MASTDDFDVDLIVSIAPDVMKSLTNQGFFEALDDRLCPTTGVNRAQCVHDYTLSTAVLRSKGYDEPEIRDIVAVLAWKGGCCDCEILYNVANTSRLREEYWTRKASAQMPQDTDD